MPNDELEPHRHNSTAQSSSSNNNGNLKDFSSRLSERTHAFRVGTEVCLVEAAAQCQDVKARPSRITNYRRTFAGARRQEGRLKPAAVISLTLPRGLASASHGRNRNRHPIPNKYWNVRPGPAVCDFTYIDDIVEGVVRVLDKMPQPNPTWSGDAPDPGSSRSPYRIYNIGNHNPVELMEYICAIEDALGIKAEKNFLPMQAGDVPATSADVQDLIEDVGFRPNTPVREGVRKFVEWYRRYYQL